jgi:putative ABC transport system permease protein
MGGDSDHFTNPIWEQVRDRQDVFSGLFAYGTARFNLSAGSGFLRGLAILLATISLYGVMSYNVARRRNEIGIRMALGAEQGLVLRMVLGEVALLVGVGLAAGLGAALASTRLLASFLYGLSPADPVTLALAAVLLAAVAALAGYLPARRASRLDPMVALREE